MSREADEAETLMAQAAHEDAFAAMIARAEVAETERDAALAALETITKRLEAENAALKEQVAGLERQADLWERAVGKAQAEAGRLRSALQHYVDYYDEGEPDCKAEDYVSYSRRHPEDNSFTNDEVEARILAAAKAALAPAEEPCAACPKCNGRMELHAEGTCNKMPESAHYYCLTPDCGGLVYDIRVKQPDATAGEGT